MDTDEKIRAHSSNLRSSVLNGVVAMQLLHFRHTTLSAIKLSCGTVRQLPQSTIGAVQKGGAFGHGYTSE